MDEMLHPEFSHRDDRPGLTFLAFNLPKNGRHFHSVSHEHAIRYIENVPAQIDTSYRRKLKKRGWN
jgi:hypothetical protein